MKPISIGEPPYVQAVLCVAAIGLVAMLYYGLPPWLPATEMWHPWDMVVATLWLGMRGVSVGTAYVRYRRWHKAPLWEVKI